MIELGGRSGGVSNAYRLKHPSLPVSTAPWVEASELWVAAEVSYLLIGERRVEVPAHGRVIAAWKSPPTGSGGTRPLITAFGSDGSEVSRIGPYDIVDSYTSGKRGPRLEFRQRHSKIRPGMRHKFYFVIMSLLIAPLILMMELCPGGVLVRRVARGILTG